MILYDALLKIPALARCSLLELREFLSQKLKVVANAFFVALATTIEVEKL
jgi:hypothetical protein